ncbi:HTH-type transcriptional regulator GbpR [Pigmentiphaga humi]|uniref:HTH-type transcriptional regulator GbpR n=1 Tax=Pigmentiphaga humi TaxID=2478468 RepID=A0A3P4AZB4_9BURK|nr:LysR substrate-binding domain-containing protein [Pigmentiphaga humi]VCU69102.1 HTH-type transcriptional regulator GbpR [Pigmentiphaga humi]
MAQLDWYLHVNLKSRQLRLLVALGDFGNLKQVAEISHVTVSTVSKALSELEKGLGLTLFRRTSQGLRPTPHGECLIAHARTILGDIGRAREDLKALSSGSVGKVTLGMLPATSSGLMAQALGLLKQRSPGTNVLVTDGTVNALMPELWRGGLDMVVGRLPAPDLRNGITEKILLEDPPVLVAGRHHPLAARKRLTWSSLRNYPWVLPPSGTLLRDPLERVLERHGVPLAGNYIEMLSIHVIQAYLQISDAVAVYGGLLDRGIEQSLTVLPLALPRLLRPTGVIWIRDRPLTPSARLMLECLEEVALQWPARRS